MASGEGLIYPACTYRVCIVLGEEGNIRVLFYMTSALRSTWDSIPMKINPLGHTYFYNSSTVFQIISNDVISNIGEDAPWPEFFASTLWAFYTHHTGFPRHAEARQGQFLCPLEDVFSFAFVVDVMAVDPEPRESEIHGLGWAFLGRGGGGISADIVTGMLSNPVCGIQYTDLSETVFLQVCHQVCIQLSLLGST